MEFTESSSRKIIKEFEKALLTNTKQRAQFQDDALQFLESEINLNQILNTFLSISEFPSLFPFIVDSGVFSKLISLLSHENSDISVAAILVIEAWLDSDQEKCLVDPLMFPDHIQLLVQNMTRLSNQDEAADSGVFSSLSILESILSIDPSFATIISQTTDILNFIAKNISLKSFSSIRQYSIEILSILLLNSPESITLWNNLDGVDLLLRALSSFKKKDPIHSDEVSLMENLFDSICNSLSNIHSKEKFLTEEGLELMIIMLENRKMSRIHAVRVIDHAIENHAKLAQHFIDIGGLKKIFPIFMGLDRKIVKKYSEFNEDSDDEAVVSIIASLLKQSRRGSLFDRIILKFKESDCEKMERLLLLFQLYSLKSTRIQEDEDFLELNQDQQYLLRLENGLSTLQQISLIFGYLVLNETDDFLKSVIADGMIQLEDSIESISKILLEYSNSLDLEKKEERLEINDMIRSLKN